MESVPPSPENVPAVTTPVVVNPPAVRVFKERSAEIISLSRVCIRILLEYGDVIFLIAPKYVALTLEVVIELLELVMTIAPAGV